MFELRKARERGHVLEGLAVALANIDEFIETIKTIAHTAGGQSRADEPRAGIQLDGARDAVAHAPKVKLRVGAKPSRPEGLHGALLDMQSDGLYRLSEDQAWRNPADASAAADRALSKTRSSANTKR